VLIRPLTVIDQEQRPGRTPQPGLLSILIIPAICPDRATAAPRADGVREGAAQADCVPL